MFYAETFAKTFCNIYCKCLHVEHTLKIGRGYMQNETFAKHLQKRFREWLHLK